MKFESVLITGGDGQLGSDLRALLANAGTTEVHCAPHSELDVTDAAQLATWFERAQPDVVFNCAAFHNVEVCETEEDRSFEVNARAVKRIAQACAERGARLVHLSTNYVFDGRADRPYAESDLPAPRSIYAISKLAGEHAALAYAPGAVVARTAGLYGEHGSASKGGNFVTRMLARAREQGELKMVADQRLSPTFTADLAAALVEAVERDAGGVVHLTASGECSWFEFTQQILANAGVDASLAPVTTTIPPGGADRPLNGVLARPDADAAGLTPLRSWQDGLADYMERIDELAASAQRS